MFAWVVNKNLDKIQQFQILLGKSKGFTQFSSLFSRYLSFSTICNGL